MAGRCRSFSFTPLLAAKGASLNSPQAVSTTAGPRYAAKGMRRFFQLLLTAMAMLTVALLSAFGAMRLAIHGREVEVPALAGLTLAEASDKAGHLGLSLHLENRFYSTQTPSGHILAQFPAPGTAVRREWTVRITESLGAQQVSIPDIVGQPERPASLALRRASLSVGVIAALPAPGESGVVLAQTPPPNAEGVDRPRVSLLISEAASSVPEALVMPQLTGLSFSTASARATAAGLHLLAAEAPAAVPPPPSAYHDSYFAGQVPQAPIAAAAPALSPSSLITGQSPAAGHRVVRGEGVRVTLGS